MESFEIGGNTYRVSKLPIMVQIAVARRILPLFAPLTPLLRELKSLTEPVEEGKPRPDINTVMLSAVTDEFYKLKDEDVNFIIGACLTVAERQQGQGWMRVWNVQARAPQFDDISLMDVMTLVMRAIMYSMGSFSPASLPNLSAQGMRS